MSHLTNGNIYIFKAPENFILINTGKNYERTRQLEEDIKNIWKRKISLNRNLFNGSMFNIKEIKKEDDNLKIILNISDYAHYLYTEENRKNNNICRSLASIALIETSDNYFVIGKMSEYTNYSDLYQLPAGSIDIEDNNDLNEKSIDPKKTIFREIKEEIGVDLHEEIHNTKCKYFIVRNNLSFLGFFYHIKIKFSKEYIEKKFVTNDNNEFQSIIFVKNNFIDIERFIKNSKIKRVDYLEKIFFVEEDSLPHFEEYF